MKKYKNPIPDGGAPLHNNRLITELNEEIWTAIESLIKNLTGACIVSGGAVTGAGPHNIAEGVVYIDGVFMRLPATAGVTLPQYVSKGALTDVNKQFADGLSKALLTTQDAVISGVDPGGVRLVIADTAPVSLWGLVHLKSDVINNLTSSNTDKALSAAQGKALKDAADAEAITRANADTTINTGITKLRDDSLQFVIDGGGVAITTGQKGHLVVPFDCTITSIDMLADLSGSIAVDIWKDSYANFPPADADSITATAVPTIAGATKSQDAVLTGWTKTLTKGDILAFNVDSVTGITRVTLNIRVTKAIA